MKYLKNVWVQFFILILVIGGVTNLVDSYIHPIPSDYFTYVDWDGQKHTGHATTVTACDFVYHACVVVPAITMIGKDERGKETILISKITYPDGIAVNYQNVGLGTSMFPSVVADSEKNPWSVYQD